MGCASWTVAVDERLNGGHPLGCWTKNMGTPPKSSILIGFSIINHPFLWFPYFWKHPLFSLFMKFLLAGWKWSMLFSGRSFRAVGMGTFTGFWSAKIPIPQVPKLLSRRVAGCSNFAFQDPRHARRKGPQRCSPPPQLVAIPTVPLFSGRWVPFSPIGFRMGQVVRSCVLWKLHTNSRRLHIGKKNIPTWMNCEGFFLMVLWPDL